MTFGNVSIRPGVVSDVEVMRKLIVNLAIYEKEDPSRVHTTLDQLRQDGFGGRNPRYRTLLATTGEEQTDVSGFAFFFDTLSLECGRSLYLEDLLVCKEMRGKGIGSQLLGSVIHWCHDHHVDHLAWQCLAWNTSSLEFYKHKIGARISGDTTSIRWDIEQIEKVLASSPKCDDGAKFPIREATQKDIAAVFKILQDEKNKSSSKSDVVERSLPTWLSEDSPKVHCWVSHRKDTQEIVGFLLAYDIYTTWDAKALWFETIYVSTDTRRKGLGTALFNKFAHFAEANGFSRIKGMCRTDNGEGRKFFATVGANETPEWVDIYMDRDCIEKFVSSNSTK
eukprot:1002985_1